MEQINLLVTLDENYIPPLRVMLKSLFYNNPGERFTIYLIHSGIPKNVLLELDRYCACHNAKLLPIAIDDKLFADAPTFRYYTQAMYYRLLACKLLPKHLEKILYLDPDTLIINPIRKLYDTDLSGYLYGACIHTSITGITEQVNRIRLDAYESEGYYNSGVLLMNLELQREHIVEEEIFSYVRERHQELILPDQDVLNNLYGPKIRPLDDSLYNYSANRYETYRMVSSGEKDVEWVMRNTVILHFCGKNKPWLKLGRGRFHVLYQHYAALADRASGTLESVRQEAVS